MRAPSLEDIECGSHHWDCCSSCLVFLDASAAATHRLQLLPLSSFLRAQLPSARMAVNRRVRACRAATLSQGLAGEWRRNCGDAARPEPVRRFSHLRIMFTWPTSAVSQGSAERDHVGGQPTATSEVSRVPPQCFARTLPHPYFGNGGAPRIPGTTTLGERGYADADRVNSLNPEKATV